MSSLQRPISDDYEALSVDENADAIGQDEQFVKPEARKGDGIAQKAALISAAVLVLVSWIAVIANRPNELGWFAFHPPLQSLAICLLAYGILSLQPTQRPATKAAGLSRHQLVIAGIAFPLFVLGTSAMLWNKAVHGAAHFTTWHGTFGIIAFVWIIGQIILGGGSVWFNGSLFGGGAKAKALWKYHRLSGYLLFPMLLLTAHLGGGWSTWVTEHTSYLPRLAAYTIAPLIIIASLYARIRPSKMKFF